MCIRTVMVVLATLVLFACEDDPIVGPTNDDTSGGGSYGVIHFNSLPEEPSVPTTADEEGTKVNPERF